MYQAKINRNEDVNFKYENDKECAFYSDNLYDLITEEINWLALIEFCDNDQISQSSNFRIDKYSKSFEQQLSDTAVTRQVSQI